MSDSVCTVSGHTASSGVPLTRRQHRRSWLTAQQLGHPHQVVAAQDQDGAQPHALHAVFARLPQTANLLAPAENLFDALAHLLAGLVAQRPRGAAIQSFDLAVLDLGGPKEVDNSVACGTYHFAFVSPLPSALRL